MTHFIVFFRSLALILGDVSKGEREYVNVNMDTFTGIVLTGDAIAEQEKYVLLNSYGNPNGDMVQFSVKANKNQLWMRSKTNTAPWSSWKEL